MQSPWTIKYYTLLYNVIIIKDSLSTTMQCGHTLNFVWYEMWNLVTWFPSEIVIVVNLCNPIFFSDFACGHLYRRLSKQLVIFLKEQLFQEKMYFPITISCLFVTDISDIRPFWSNMSGSDKRTKRHVGRPENVKATWGNVFVVCGGAEEQ